MIGMAFLEEFIANIASLPSELQCNYELMRGLDLQLQDHQRHNEVLCEQEIEEIRRGAESGNITPDASVFRFSDDVLNEQKICAAIADEKVALAVEAYDLVDGHIQRLDKYMKRFDEELRRGEREVSAGAAAVEH